jgi:hypothetical protein
MFWGLTNEHKKFAKHPEEWDFRPIKEEVLHLTILYEYARAAKWVTKEFERWHKQPLQLPEDSDGFKAWNGKTVGEAIKSTTKADFPSDVFNHLIDTEPEWFLQNRYDVLTSISLQFPRPFLSLIEKVRPEDFPELAPHWKEPPKGFTVLESLPKLSPKQTESFAQAGGIFHMAVKINLSAGKKIAKRQAALVIDELDKRYPNRKFKVPRARGAVLPWHELKELAALRLSQKGLDGEGAREFIQKYAAPMAAQDVLPRYSSSGAWSKAVKNAENRIQELYPEP